MGANESPAGFRVAFHEFPVACQGLLDSLVRRFGRLFECGKQSAAFSGGETNDGWSRFHGGIQLRLAGNCNSRVRDGARICLPEDRMALSGPEFEPLV